MKHLLAVPFIVAFLVACSPPSGAPSRPQPTVDLTGTWAVTMELEGFTVGPFTWVLVQSGSRIRGYTSDVPDTPPCGEGEERIVSDRWTGRMSFNPSNCPTGYAGFQSGSASFNIRASNTVFGGSITITATSPAHLVGTYRGSLRGVRIR